MQLQNDGSDVCGQHFIMFLHDMSYGLGFKNFLDNFSQYLKKNDNVQGDHQGCGSWILFIA